VLEYVAVCNNVLQCFAVFGSVFHYAFRLRSRGSVSPGKAIVSYVVPAACVAVCYRVSQCVAVCCRVLQCVAVCFCVLQFVSVCCSMSLKPKSLVSGYPGKAINSLIYCARCMCCCVLQFVAVCCSALQCVAVCCSVSNAHLQAKITRHGISRQGNSFIHSACCSVLQCVAVRCSALQCVAVCHTHTCKPKSRGTG